MNQILQKYRVLEKKGEGTFAEVLKCQNMQDGTLWACKKMKHHYNSLDQVNSLREVQAMRRLRPHPNIIDLKEIVFERRSGVLILVCELMDKNIYELIKGRKDRLPPTLVKNLMYQLCRAVDHLHRNGIFHRDIKPENILVKNDVLKLADFGSCRSIYSKQPFTEYISTRWYRSPECLLTNGHYSFKMDIWSVGCVFYEILNLRPLFAGANEVDQIAKIHEVLGTPDSEILSKFKNRNRHIDFNFPNQSGSGLEKLMHHGGQEEIELIYKLCTYDPDERITAKQALKHSFFRELRNAEKRLIAKMKERIEGLNDAAKLKSATPVEADSTRPNKLRILDSDVHPTEATEAKVPDRPSVTSEQNQPVADLKNGPAEIVPDAEPKSTHYHLPSIAIDARVVPNGNATFDERHGDKDGLIAMQSDEIQGGKDESSVVVKEQNVNDGKPKKKRKRRHRYKFNQLDGARISQIQQQVNGPEQTNDTSGYLPQVNPVGHSSVAPAKETSEPTQRNLAKLPTIPRKSKLVPSITGVPTISLHRVDMGAARFGRLPHIER